MKKFFTLVAVAVMALSANAQKVIDFSTATEADFQNLDGFTATVYNDKPALNYDGGGVVGSFTVFGVKYEYKNSAVKENVIRMSDQGVYTNGKGFTVSYQTTPSAKVLVELCAKGSSVPAFTLNAGTGELPADLSTTKNEDKKFVTKTAELTADATGLVSFTETAAGFTFVKLTDNGGSTGITEVASDKLNENAPVYNLAGQRVSKDAKGILIQNGKKFINK